MRICDVNEVDQIVQIFQIIFMKGDGCPLIDAPKKIRDFLYCAFWNLSLNSIVLKVSFCNLLAPDSTLKVLEFIHFPQLSIPEK